MSILHSTLPRSAEDRVRDARRQIEPIADEYPFVSHFLDHDGVFQHYLDEGPRAADPLLFVHGNPTWSFAWRRLIRALREDYRCVAPDHVGCGLSDKPQSYPYLLEQHVRNLEALVLQLDLRRLPLVVHDWGGPIAFGVARRHPERIARLVLLNTAAFPARRMPLRLAVCRVPVVGPLAVRGLGAFSRAAVFLAVEKPLSETVKRGYLLPYDSYEHRVATQAFVKDIPMSPRHPSYAELEATAAALPSFADRPALILWGERDWCFTPAFRKRWQEILPRAKTYRFPHAGHYLFEDEGVDVRDKVADFLAQHPIP